MTDEWFAAERRWLALPDETDDVGPDLEAELLRRLAEDDGTRYTLAEVAALLGVDRETPVQEAAHTLRTHEVDGVTVADDEDVTRIASAIVEHRKGLMDRLGREGWTPATVRIVPATESGYVGDGEVWRLDGCSHEGYTYRDADRVLRCSNCHDSAVPE